MPKLKRQRKLDPERVALAYVQTIVESAKYHKKLDALAKFLHYFACTQKCYAMEALLRREVAGMQRQIERQIERQRQRRRRPVLDDGAPRTS